MPLMLCVPSQKRLIQCDDPSNLTKLSDYLYVCRFARWSGVVLLKTFIVGVVLGIAGAVAALHFYPVVDLQREASIVAVAANGGNVESFHVNVPMDRIRVGASGQRRPLPVGMQWPADELLKDVRVEMFKIRNERDTVVGVAARTAATDESDRLIEWVLHLPARGSVYVNMNPQALPGGFRQGEMRGGSREFSGLTGGMTERWIPNESGDEDAPAGRIRLETSFVGRQEASL